jgi:hypothetical protein
MFSLLLFAAGSSQVAAKRSANFSISKSRSLLSSSLREMDLFLCASPLPRDPASLPAQAPQLLLVVGKTQNLLPPSLKTGEPLVAPFH